MEVVSLFSSSGGSSLGYKRAGCDVIGAVDCAPEGYTTALLDTYRTNHDTPLFEYDISELGGQTLLDSINRERGQLDILDGSPPCRPFTNSNTSETRDFNHKGQTLFGNYTRLIDEIEPRYFVAENVPALAQTDTRGYFKWLCDELRAAGRGYTLTVNKIEAHKLGSPHRRTRLIFVGSRNDQLHPDPVTYTHTTTVREVLKGVENGADELEWARDKLQSSKNAAGYTLLTEGDSLDSVTGSSGYTHTRLAWDRPSQNPTSVIELVHPSENRYLTISELKRIMMLPDDYTLVADSFNKQWKAAIQCLPPVLMKTVAETIIDADSQMQSTENQPAEDAKADD